MYLTFRKIFFYTTTTNLGTDDGINAVFQVDFEHVGLGYLLVPVGGKPDPGQRTSL